jgi:large subunit ribosomal protein L4
MTTSLIENKIFPEKLIKKKAIGLIHRLYITQLKNFQKHTASTKTKSEVRGGGRKPRPQKGQGYARSGSIRSPLWVGGGVIFGPKPHLVHKKINKKEKRLAIISAFYLKKKQWVFVDENFFDQFNEIKTKTIVASFKNLNFDFKKEKILCILSELNKKFWLSSRNLKTLKITKVNCLNVKDLLEATSILLTKNTLELINSNYKKNYE